MKNILKKNLILLLLLLIIIIITLYLINKNEYVSQLTKSGKTIITHLLKGSCSDIIYYEKFEEVDINKKILNENPDFKNFIDTHIFYDENNNLLNHKNNELIEQYQAFKYLSPEDIVLELGGRYGTVSTVINKIVNDKTSHVVVEPDLNIIPILEKNRSLNNCYFEILSKFISNKNKKIIYDGYGTHLIDDDSSKSTNNKINYQDFKEKYPQKFNVLIVDCEGCLCDFLDILNEDINNFNKIIFESDQPHLCDYNKIKEKLINNGFKEKENLQNMRFVYIKE